MARQEASRRGYKKTAISPGAYVVDILPTRFEEEPDLFYLNPNQVYLLGLEEYHEYPKDIDSPLTYP